MERHDIKRRLGSYTITKELTRDLSAFFCQTLSHTLSPDLAGFKIEENTAITIIHGDDRINYGNISKCRDFTFHNKMDGLIIELAKVVKTRSYEKAFVLQLSFSKEIEDNYLYMALQDAGATVKLTGICQKLMAVLAPYKNVHSRFYRSELLSTGFFVAGSVCGTLAFAAPAPPYGLLLAIAAVLGLGLFAYSSIKGYSTFELAR
ncbi:hypothetical protein [Puia dinghuensis]|uniref:Uncharacterized protein n=1 Tax=Puia dinghuensis TaxID=1792502 RepID=A0A8J2XU54_9BACT|nr:hypothetical protein [Puia dinghuensis]GGB23006.1 hypothetical protein GCM10011511_53660 [Puia dinghuensis]